MSALLESIDGVRCINASRVRNRPSGYRLNGWEIKPFAIVNSRFEEVLFIDCDNVPTRDPSFLLESDPYRAAGAIFWPDRWMKEGDQYRTLTREGWAACGVPYREEPEFESGQMVINKRRCWKALQLALFYNAHSDYFYQFLLGDKDTFHMAWRRVGQTYAMPKHRPQQDWEDGPVLYQHDFQGRRLFQHRNQDKWDYDGRNSRIPGFQHEEFCRGYVTELRRAWDGIVRRFPEDYTAAERSAYEAVTAERLLHYGYDGIESRLLEFKPDFTLGIGRSKWETCWDIEEGEGGGVSLILSSPLRKMCVLDRSNPSSWTGRCLHFERLPITLEPIAALPADRREVAEEIRTMLAQLPDQSGPAAEEIRKTRLFLYRRVGHDARTMEFCADHTIGEGAGPSERWWYVDDTAGPPRLVICGDHGRICQLERLPDGSWEGDWLPPDGKPVELIPKSSASAAGPAGYYSLSMEDRAYYA
jgi:hypothetical protein